MDIFKAGFSFLKAFAAIQCHFVPSGYRHPSPTIVARTVRILHTLLSLVNKHRNCDKFEVNTQSVAYLAGKQPKSVGPVSNSKISISLCSNM